MSIKAATFASIVTNPHNTHMFEVSIPGFDYSIIIESTTFPAQGKTREISLWFQGERITYPGLPENGGTWAFTIPESSDAKIKAQFDAMAKSFYDQKTGIFKPQIWKTIQIFSKDLAGNVVFSCKLHGCWIAQRNNVNLSAQSADQYWKWDYTFVYNWFEDGDIENVQEPLVSPLS